MPLFKYLPRQYADALLVTGAIKVGTLFDFRKMEHARGVADPSEGTKTILARPDREIITEDQAEKDAFFELSSRVLAGSVSTDACIEINDISGFLYELTRALNAVAPVWFDGIHEVQYRGRTQEQTLTRFQDFNPAQGLHPGLIEDPSFRRQKEVRAIWSPISTMLPQPIITSSRHLPQYRRNVSTCMA
jgi:hypothetical protein